MTRGWKASLCFVAAADLAGCAADREDPERALERMQAERPRVRAFPQAGAVSRLYGAPLAEARSPEESAERK